MSNHPIDQAVLADQGRELPELAFLRGRQRFQYDGAWLAPEAVQLLLQLADGLVLGRLQRGGHAAELDALEDAGMVDGTSLTELGSVTAGLMTSSPHTFRVSAVHHGRQEMLQLWSGNGVALSFAGAAWNGGAFDPEGRVPGPGHVNVRILPLLDVSTHILQWLGIGPAWSLELSPGGLSTQVLDAKVMHDAPGPLPEDANAAFREAWDQPWLIWSFEASGEGGTLEALTYVHAGTRGQYRIAQPDDDTVLLFAVGASVVLDQIEDRIQALVFDRPVQSL
ncbi:hypothetical protein ACQ3I4_09565 [Zafaria sp. Z1313]|uniref:hypothetical protein n=1 Tax=unclassified Zafaria TaxID=2828765 RepID=UPI002E7973F9|nr:hypothetical protein [Zafaria sp. J156]MEE1621834.1 hypothetical protein [Zafaria sp. J156]